MKILSLDTATGACSAAVVDTQAPAPLAAVFVPMERGHAEALPPMVAEVMRMSGLGIGEIDRIAVTTGPGSFTGVRIGLAFARGLGLARQIPVIGIDSLTAIAANAPEGRPLLVASDARNGEIYAATFDAGRQLIAGPHAMTATAAAADVPGGTLVLGSASQSVIRASGRADLEQSHAGDLPVAAHFARLAVGVAPGGMPSPLYLRAPDAKPQTTPLRKIGCVTIECVGPAASSLLSALHSEVFHEAWSEKSFTEMLETPGTEAAIASEGGEPLAFIITRRAANEAEIITIGTRPSAQRRGVARQLLEQHMVTLARAGVSNLFLEVSELNTAALKLYMSCSFAEVGRRKGYYRRRDGLEDAIVMRREIHS